MHRAPPRSAGEDAEKTKNLCERPGIECPGAAYTTFSATRGSMNIKPEKLQNMIFTIQILYRLLLRHCVIFSRSSVKFGNA